MRILVCAALAAMLTAWAAIACAEDEGEEFSEVEYYARLARQEQTARQAEPAPQYAASPVYMKDCREGLPSGVFVVLPQYFNSRSDKAAGLKRNGLRMKSEKSHANGMGVGVLFNKRFTDSFSLGVVYQYAFMSVRGGWATDDVPNLTGLERSRYHSHGVGLVPEFDFKRWGRLQLSGIQYFDGASGDEILDNAGVIEIRSVDRYRANITSLMAWYEKDFTLGCNWKLTPYAGWRSLYGDIGKRNNWDQPNPSAPDYRVDDNDWAHFVSAGLKVGYQCGSFGFNVRGGVNHRATGDDLPIYGNRAVAPGVIHYSHRASQDRTIGTFGAGISYNTPKRLVVSVNYDGFYGRDTSAHMGTLAFSLPF